jgi:hypothetical protein
VSKVRAGQNITKPVLTVRHSALVPVGDGGFKRECPVCREGLLLVHRDLTSFKLLPDDNCILCGQRVRYVDFLERPKGSTVC